MGEEKLDDFLVRLMPVDNDIVDLMDRLISQLPKYAVGAVWIDTDDVWRPTRKSKKGNYYTKKTWRPLFGFELRLLAEKLRLYLSWRKYRYCQWAGYLVTKDKKIYICCVSQPEQKTYVLFPKAHVTLQVLIEDLTQG